MPVNGSTRVVGRAGSGARAAAQVLLDHDGGDRTGEQALALLDAAAGGAQVVQQDVGPRQAATQPAADADSAGLRRDVAEFRIGGRDGVEVGIGDVQPAPDALQPFRGQVPGEVVQDVQRGQRLRPLPREPREAIVEAVDG